MPIEPVALLETPQVIGDNFPPHDEGAYLREAASQRVSASQASSAEAATQQANLFTIPNFRGATGSAMTTSLSGHSETFTGDQLRHQNVAGWLDAAAQNIIETKNAMNAASEDYHASYAAAQAQAVKEAWPQDRLRNHKNQLLAAAQQRVAAARATFEQKRAAIAAGITQGATPTAPEEIAPRSTPSTAGTAGPGGGPALLGGYDADNAARL